MYHKWRSYVWFAIYQARQTEFFVILCYFLPFYSTLPPSNNPENQHFEKMEKTLEDIIIVHMNTINQNHVMYDFWDMERNRQNLFLLWTIFCPFTPPPPPLTTQRIKILKKWKKPRDIIILHKCTIDDNHMIYGSWDINSNSQNFVIFFALLPPLQSKKWKYQNNEKNT